jgi:hypothetical protein
VTARDVRKTGYLIGRTGRPGSSIPRTTRFVLPVVRAHRVFVSAGPSRSVTRDVQEVGDSSGALESRPARESGRERSVREGADLVPFSARFVAPPPA